MLMVLVAVTAVASFESVGNILVVAMFVVPPATAYLLTDRLPVMIYLSATLAAMAAVLGHIGALAVPAWFGFQSTTTAGMMAVAIGLFLFAGVAFSPKHGVIVKLIRQRILSLRILSDDVVGLLYRIQERNIQNGATSAELREVLFADRFSLKLVLGWLQHVRQINYSHQSFRLTESGINRAQKLVRSHRLWEQYLMSEVGLPSDQIHDKAERFDIFTDPDMREHLDVATSSPKLDPHGRPIPDERAPGE